MPKPRRPAWETYERATAALFARSFPPEFSLTPNARLRGTITGVERQIDVLIDLRHDTENSRRMIVDAKRYARRVTVKDVEAFIGLMQDVRASHGYLVCPVGFTKAAVKRAQSWVSVCLVPLDLLETFDARSWPTCLSAECATGRVFWDGFPEMGESIRSALLIELSPRRRRTLTCVGKCDRCSAFHVRCTACGWMALIPFDDERDYGHQCDCRPSWFWLASVEEDERGAASAELHVVSTFDGAVTTVCRRSL